MASVYMFSHYWPGDGAGGGVVAEAGQYPAWQAGVVIGSFPYLALPPALLRRWRKRIRGWAEKAYRRLPTTVVMLPFLWQLIRSDDFRKAYRIVRKISHDPSTRNLCHWTEVNRLTATQPQWTENMYRGLAARIEFGSHEPIASLLIELAYLAYKRKHGK
jgi:hypothetical protein